jgi:hypothetical protein
MMKTRLLSLITAAVVLVAGVWGAALLAAPTASALTQDEALYVTLLTDEGIGPRPGYSWNDLFFLGHAIAYDLRSGADLGVVTYRLWENAPYLDMDGASSVVAASVVAFAPELVPIYIDESPPGDMVA